MDKTQQQAETAAKTPITDIRLKLVGEDGNAFNEKTFVMESFSLNLNTYRTPITLSFT